MSTTLTKIGIWESIEMADRKNQQIHKCVHFQNITNSVFPNDCNINVKILLMYGCENELICMWAFG